MSGGVKRVTISNCVFEGTERGIRIKTMRGRGGVVEDIRVSNVSMYNIINEGILITMRYQPTSPEPLSVRTPEVNSIQLSGINIRGASRPIAIYGLEERDVAEISFNDLRIYSDKGILVENASGISFHDIRMHITQGSPLEAKDSKNITWDLISVVMPTNERPFLKLINCQGVRISNCYQPENFKMFVSEDEDCGEIFIVNNVLPGAFALHNKKGRNIVQQNNTLRNENIPLTN
jgi:hypothetical protein